MPLTCPPWRPQAIEEELNKRESAKKKAAVAAAPAAAATKGGKGKTGSLTMALPMGLGGSALPSKEVVSA